MAKFPRGGNTFLLLQTNFAYENGEKKNKDPWVVNVDTVKQPSFGDCLLVFFKKVKIVPAEITYFVFTTGNGSSSSIEVRSICNRQGITGGHRRRRGFSNHLRHVSFHHIYRLAEQTIPHQQRTNLLYLYWYSGCRNSSIVYSSYLRCLYVCKLFPLLP